MKNYNIDHDILSYIEGLYNISISDVYKNGAIGDRLDTTIGVRQGCLLSTTVFNIFLKRIMAVTMDGHSGIVYNTYKYRSKV